MTDFDLIVVGAGPSGIMAAIVAAKRNKKVLLLEKMPEPGLKLKASGGGRCNLTNTLASEEFVKRFGRNGRFMIPALRNLSNSQLLQFMAEIGVKCHSPDGFRVFPESHNSETVLSALNRRIHELNVDLRCEHRVSHLILDNGELKGVKTESKSFFAPAVVIATGGKGYPALGATGDGYEMARKTGHRLKELFPAMIPLQCQEKWVEQCRENTIGKAIIKIDLPQASGKKASGDLIFTRDGLAGPLIMDFSREITPLLAVQKEVPVSLKLVKGMNGEQLMQYLKKRLASGSAETAAEILQPLLPKNLSEVMCQLAGLSPGAIAKEIKGHTKEKLINLLSWTPLTITGHSGFASAMVTRGGVDLKQIDNQKMQSRVVKGLFFCGEIVDLDGPCGGFNLQWCFSSGYLAGSNC